ncbi:MAG TPA: hypothetical protein VEU96_10550 [Bryobacteraceae bacterium]|nr:hypothetical protein [Bryobacteraceae bacterium]
MRKTSLLLFLAVLPTLGQNPHQRYPGQLTSLSATTASGIQFRYAVVSQPPRNNLAGRIDISGVRTGDSDAVHRFVIDKVHRQYFGYDISAERGTTPGQFLVTIAPLTLRPDQWPDEFRLPNNALSPVSLPKYPEPQVVNDGDIIELDLLVSPDGQHKVVDYIEVSAKPEPRAASSTAAPKDFTPDDGPIHIDFNDAQLWMNGEKYAGSTTFDTQSGATVFFYFPGEGRYILSLVPHEGFTKMGAIRDNVISLQSNGRQYEVRTMHLILGSKGAWNLYGLHDPSYTSHASSRSVQVGTSRLERLVPRH